MRKLLSRLWDDDCGIIISAEVILVGTILVIGSIVGLTTLQSAVTRELNDAAAAYDSTNGRMDGSYDIYQSEGRVEFVCGGY